MNKETFGIDIPTAEEAKKAMREAKEAKIKTQLTIVSEAIKKAIADRKFPIYYSEEMCSEVEEVLIDKGYEVSYKADYHDSYYIIDIKRD